MSTLNVATTLEYRAARTPDHPFLSLNGHHVTYLEAEHGARRVANSLEKLGISRGDRVALLLPNTPTLVECFYGVLKVGALPVAMDLTSPGPEIGRLLEVSDAAAVIAFEPFFEAAREGFRAAPACRHLVIANAPGSDSCPPPAQRLGELTAGSSTIFETVPTRPEDPAAIIFTSGTTGLPKGAVLSHMNYYYLAEQLGPLWRISTDSIIFMLGPASHIFGQALVLVGCHWGGMLSMMPRFDMEMFLQTIERDGVNFFAGVPTILHYMLSSPAVEGYDLSSLRRVMVSGAPTPPEVAARFKKRFGVELVMGYGMTEGIPLTHMDTDVHDFPEGSAGRPPWGTKIRIVNEENEDLPTGEAGEILARGPQVFLGYHKDDEATAETMRGEWLHTGDIGRLDRDGNLFLVDRKKDVILRAGYTIYPAEVERVLNSHSAVAEAAVIGVAVEEIGEEIKACVVLRTGSQTSSGDIIGHCKRQLAAHKYPRLIEFRESLPRSPSGKCTRRF